MSIRCCSSMASRATVPVPRPFRNLWISSWYMIAAVLPFGIKMTIFYLHSSVSAPSRKSVCVMATTLCKLVAAGESSRVAAISHWQRCPAHIPEDPPEQFRQSLRTAQAISSSSRMSSSTRKRRSPTGIGSPGGGTCW